VRIRKEWVSTASGVGEGVEGSVEWEGEVVFEMKNPDVEGLEMKVRDEDPGVWVKNPESVGSRMNERFGAEVLMMNCFVTCSKELEVDREWWVIFRV